MVCSRTSVTLQQQQGAPEGEGILPVHGAPTRDRDCMVRLITNGRSRNESSDESLRNMRRHIMMGGGTQMPE